MCGIAGLLSKDFSKEAQETIIKRMVSVLAHRGPDELGIYLSRTVALGHARLSILDLSNGSQPMSAGRYTIVYNGEIYNFKELRQDLIKRGLYFETSSDTEVVLKAFEAYGFDCFPKFNGQFALLLWDKRERKLIIARDRYGVRPLYILEHQQRYYFSSELKAFDVLEGFSRTFSMPELLEHALIWNTIADRTVFTGIRSLPAGTFEVYEHDKRPVNYRYYEIGEEQGHAVQDPDSAADEFKALLDDAVRVRLRSDVPIGCYLSGGIDSSVISHLAATHKKDPIRTFSIAFDDKDFDESPYQREMASLLKSDHSELRINYGSIADNFLKAVYHIERPVFRTAPVPLYLLAKSVSESGVKVVLTGEGADEILFGYDSYKELKMLEFWSKVPDSRLRPLLIKKLNPHLQYYKNPRQFRLLVLYYEGFLGDFNNELGSLNIRLYNNKIVLNYFNKDFNLAFNKEDLLTKIKRTLPANFYSWSTLQRNQFLEMKTLLSGYLLSSQGDRMSMAFGVEGRYPFLDHRIVERLFYYPSRLKLKGFDQKYLLGKAFRQSLPPGILNRPKMPYRAPDVKSFFSNGKVSESVAYFLSGDLLRRYGIFEEKTVSRLVNKFKDAVPDQIGYRDNMLITFILSAHMVQYWIEQTKKNAPCIGRTIVKKISE